MIRHWIIAILSTFLFTGCAQTKVKPIEYTDRKATGLRFYESKPFIQVKVGEDGLVDPANTAIVYLPDYTRGFALKQSAGLGSNHTEVAITDGWNLTNLNSNVDSQVDDLITAAGSLSSLAEIAFRGNAAVGEGQRELGTAREGFYLIPIEYDDETGEFLGIGKPIDPYSQVAGAK